MKSIESIAHIDEQHRLVVELLPEIPDGPVKIMLLSTNATDEEREWQVLINHSWEEDWSDPREDIHTLKDGKEEQAYVIPQDRFDDLDYIEKRVRLVPLTSQGALRSTLKYLYLIDGPTNLPVDRRKVAELFLEPAEVLLARWLATRTNGSERKRYGANSLKQARIARYRCERCRFADVRVLELDHVYGHAQKTFACLCANCHKIKSRKEDWTGKRRDQGEI